MTTVLFMK